MIPVFVIVRDRFEQLKQTVSSLEKAEGIDIVLIDNQSTYEPTVEYLKNSPHQVHYLNQNLYHNSPWTSGLVPKDSYYGVTDPDIRVVDECPSSWPSFMIEILSTRPSLPKVGFSLRIDNIPDHYAFKQNVLLHEGQFWLQSLGLQRNVEIYNSPVDTTLAIYNKNSTYSLAAVRTGWPYTAEHLAWYVDSNNLTEDELYYRNHANRHVASWPYADGV